jgi:myo-inositol-1(or 4)-monophosphatase
MNYFKVAKQLEQIFKKAYKLYMQKPTKTLEHKSKNDLLTQADLNMDAFISNKLKKLHPNFNLLTEELSNKTKLKGFTFVIDPIDGTCNFVNNLKLSGIQGALFLDDVCVMSVIYLPYQKQLFYAVLNEGAFLNNKKITIDKTIPHSSGILQLSDFYSNVKTSMQKQFKLVSLMQNIFLKTRLFGAACIDFTNLVTNKAQAYICYYNHIWDIAPGLLLIKEAGGLYGTLENKPYKWNYDNLIVANNEETLKLIQNEYQKINK